MKIDVGLLFTLLLAVLIAEAIIKPVYIWSRIKVLQMVSGGGI